jgi:hypothetical protein
VSSSASVDVGELYPMGVYVTDPDGAALNAQVVTLEITQPDLTVLTPPIANPPGLTGQYTCDFIPAQAGHHSYVWRTTVPTLVLPGSFEVTPVGPGGILSLPKAKGLLRLRPDDYEQDDEVRSVIRAVTAVVEDETKLVIMRRQISETTRVRRATRTLTVTQLPVLTVDRVQVVGGTTDIMGPLDVDENGIVDLPVQVSGRVRTLYTAGMVVIPDNYIEAAGYILQHLWANRLGSAERPRVGGTTEGDTPSTVSYSIPNRARDLLGRPRIMIG